MSRTYILLGVIATFLLLLVAPPLGLLFLLGCLVVGTIRWLAEYRSKARPCPVCGEHVPNGITECSSCGHDFRAAARS
jgi:hypothetical protein